MKQIQCATCGAPLTDPDGVHCDDCRARAHAKILELRARLAQELGGAVLDEPD